MNLTLNPNLKSMTLKQNPNQGNSIPNLTKSHIALSCRIIKARTTTILSHDQLHYLKRKHAPHNILIGLNTTHTDDIIT